MITIAILVLAAGSSTRMKEIKQLLKIKNQTLLEIALENAKKSKASSVFCVLGANAEKIKQETTAQNIVFIYNENYKKGLSSSIVAGLHFLEKQPLNLDAVLIMLADQPDINENYLNQLIGLHQKNTGKIIASNYGEKLGVPAIFPNTYFKDLKLLEGDKGAGPFLQSKSSGTIVLKNKTALIDLDTQEEYQYYIKTTLK